MQEIFIDFYYFIIHAIVFGMGAVLIKWHFEIKHLKLWVEHFKSENNKEREFGDRILKQFNKEHATVMELKKEVDELNKIIEEGGMI